MARNPVVLYGPNGQRLAPSGGRRMHEGAAQPWEKRISAEIWQQHNADHDQNVGEYDWQRMLSVSRYLYANVGPYTGAVNDIGVYAVGDAWEFRSLSENKKFADAADAWVNGWFPWADRRGQPFDFQTDLFLASVAMTRDGDSVMVLTWTNDGLLPQVQWIPAHRIGSRHFGNVERKAHKSYGGLRECNGVIYNRDGRAVAYNILGDEENGGNDTPVSARDVVHTFAPHWFDQGRGVTHAAPGIQSLLSYRNFERWEEMAAQLQASTGLIEHNEAGGPQTDGTDGPFEEQTNVVSKTIIREDFEGGAIRYFKAGSGANLTPFNPADRPARNTQAWVDNHVLRGAFAGMGWPLELVWDASKIGGASVRMVLAKGDRTVRQHQKRLGRPYSTACLYSIAKASAAEILPPLPADWTKHSRTLPRRLTVDNGRDMTADIEQYKLGMSSGTDFCGEDGRNYYEVVDERVEERKYLEAKCREAGVNPNDVQLLTPNGNPGAQAKPTDANADGAKKNEVIDLRSEIDTYGIAVRAGAITPTLDDENAFRAKLGLPAINADIADAWKKDGNVRRPITLTQPGGGRAAPGGQAGIPPETDETDPEQ